MQRGDHLSPVADRRGHPLDGTRTHVADGEDARQIGLERTWTLRPVLTKPLSSSATPEPASQSVFGSAPMNRNRWWIE
jgi:hypothetical protein